MTEVQTQLLATVAPIFMLRLIAERRALFADGRATAGWVWAITPAAVALGLVTIFCVSGVDDGIDGRRGELVMNVGMSGIGLTVGISVMMLFFEGWQSRRRPKKRRGGA